MIRSLLVLLIGVGTLRAAAAAADTEWLVREQFESFSLLADYPVDAQEIHAQLKSLTLELDDTLGVKATSEPIQIVLFESRKKYLSYLGSAVPTSRSRRALFVRKGSLTSIYCYRSDATSTDLRHEMTHAVLHQYLPFLPLWMDEGLAEYFEEEPEQRLSSSRTKNARWKSAVGWSPDLGRLEQIGLAGEMNANDYRDCWALCCYLLNESRESRSLLRDYLQKIHDGHAPPQFSDSMKAAGNDWRVRSRTYFRKPTFKLAGELSEPR